jgi:hypothetical protein
MITVHLDQSAEHLKTFLPPYKGTWKTLPSHLLPDDVLQDSNNVALIEGKLRSRPGLLALDTFQFLDTLSNDPARTTRIHGGMVFINVLDSKFLIASSLQTVWLKRDTASTWSLLPSLVQLQGSSLYNIRMCSLQQGSNIYLLYANALQQLMVSNNLTTLTPITGLQPGSLPPPVARDVCVSFDRVVVMQPPYTIAWSESISNNFTAFTNWPALNQAILTQTTDALVAINPLGVLNFAVYKEGNIYAAVAQGGPSSQAFRFEHRGEYEGPCCPNSIVNVNGSHMYMTPTGRVAIFDGSQHTWICDGLWPFLRQDIDRTFIQNVFGVYNYKLSEVTFWYPRKGDSGDCKGMLCIDLPYPSAGISTYAYFLGTSSFAVSYGLSIRRFTHMVSPVVFGCSSLLQDATTDVFPPRAFLVDEDTYTDSTRPFTCSLSTGLFKPVSQVDQGNISQGKGKSDLSGIYIPTIELYTTRDITKGFVDLSPLISNGLETNGDREETDRVDLTQIFPNEYHGFNRAGSFLGMHLQWDSRSKVEYKGAEIYGRKTP